MGQQASGGVIAGLIIGIAIGVGTALAYAPQHGQQTRNGIKRRALQLRDQGMKLIEQVKKEAKTFREVALEGAENYRQETLCKLEIAQ